MKQKNTAKILASISLIILVAMQIFGFTGLLIHFSTREIAERFDTLLYPYHFVLAMSLALNFALFLYLLNSFDLIGKKKSDVTRQFFVIADVGLMFCAFLQAIDVYLWHYGLFAFCIVVRIIILLFLLRITTAHFGRKIAIYWEKAPFNLYLGIIQFQIISALATSLYVLYGGAGMFTVNVRAVLLILCMTVMSMVIGLKFLNIASMFTIFLFEGAIAAMHLRTPERYPEIEIAAILGMAALVAAMIAALIKKRGRTV